MCGCRQVTSAGDTHRIRYSPITLARVGSRVRCTFLNHCAATLRTLLRCRVRVCKHRERIINSAVFLAVRKKFTSNFFP